MSAVSTGNLLRGSFALGVLATVAGALFKIMHYPGGSWLLLTGLGASLAFVVLAAVEIVGSRRVAGGEKVLWLAVVLLGNSLGGLLYLLLGRRRVVDGPGQ